MHYRPAPPSRLTQAHLLGGCEYAQRGLSVQAFDHLAVEADGALVGIFRHRKGSDYAFGGGKFSFGGTEGGVAERDLLALM